MTQNKQQDFQLNIDGSQIRSTAANMGFTASVAGRC